MANKITCPNCGHSWDKSTSTGKDAHVCHICGKANVNMKDGGWLERFADGGGEYLGTTNKGFNYNGAWGGPSMAMGGSMPGAVGFTYARTGSIPDNGPYAKKTKASAQNGMEMSFYQNGLDWTPKNISMNGSKLKKAQAGFQKRLAEEIAKLDNPLSALQLSKKGFSKDQIKTIQNAASKEQPVIQNPKGKQLTREQILAKNQQYAEEQGKRFDPNSGAVTPFLSPSVGRAFDRANESVLNTANAAMSVPTKLVQSAYKPGYTAKDALLGKPSGSSLTEDVLTDPQMIASLGGKGLLKGLLKGALGKGAIGKEMLSSVLLPFYASREKSPAALTAFTSKLNEVKDLLTTPEARSAFRNVGDVITRRPDIAALDQAYSNAIVDANLPVNAIDKYANSLISIDPAANALSAEQVKYLNNLTGLQTNVGLLDPYAIPFKNIMEFIIDNSKKISPRDILPHFYSRVNISATKSEKNEFLKKLYDSYSGQNVNNPLAEYSAATDLVSLADTYGNRFSSTLSEDIGRKMRELTKLGDEARPSVYIDAPYFKDEYNNEYSNEAVKMMARRYNPVTRQIDYYTSIPKTQDLMRESIAQGKRTIQSVNEIFNNPTNKGKFYTASHNLSLDSHPLGLELLSRNKDLLDFVPVHEGAAHRIGTESNTLGGLSNYSSNRRTYLNELKTRFDKNLGNIQPTPSPFGGFQVRPTAGTRQLQEQMVESGLLNHHINEFNKKIGTNMPSAYYSGFYNELIRPNVGAIIKKDGGPVKDNMGYWNPENWGEPVEIGSNNITMEGVYEPLIGVSDEGDTKMMYPGENYKFKGKKVTEYPVKKKSGGWLDKYK
jgi:hypothetical protein